MRFEMFFKGNDIEYRLTKPNQPWTNGQVERMNRTITEAAVKLLLCKSHEQLRVHFETARGSLPFHPSPQDAH